MRPKLNGNMWATKCEMVILALALLQTLDLCFGRRARNTDLLEDYNNESSLPRFSQPIPNVTVTNGKDALLPCVVENLRSYKVAWVRVDTQTILTIHENVITRNPRITLSHSDSRSWFLQLRNTQEQDRGWYMCQINTDPMRSLMGYLEVVVPPQIIDQDTSMDIVAKEGSNVTLHCKAKGYPEPYVMWRREDNREIQYNGNVVNVIDGEVFHIIKISRLHMGAYLCIASNGIPPSISKRVEVKVQFPPMMTIPHQLEGAYLGQDVTIECQTEAHPKSINYWTNERGDMIVSGDKYESFVVDTSYQMFMRLKIRNLTRNDFGTFKCVAKNSLGETDGNIKLYEIPAPPTTTTTTMKTTPLPTRAQKWPKKISNEVISPELLSPERNPYEDLEKNEMSSGAGNLASHNPLHFPLPPLQGLITTFWTLYRSFQNSIISTMDYNLIHSQNPPTSPLGAFNRNNTTTSSEQHIDKEAAGEEQNHKKLIFNSYAPQTFRETLAGLGIHLFNNKYLFINIDYYQYGSNLMCLYFIYFLLTRFR